MRRARRLRAAAKDFALGAEDKGGEAVAGVELRTRLLREAGAAARCLDEPDPAAATTAWSALPSALDMHRVPFEDLKLEARPFARGGGGEVRLHLFFWLFCEGVIAARSVTTPTAQPARLPGEHTSHLILRAFVLLPALLGC